MEPVDFNSMNMLEPIVSVRKTFFFQRLFLKFRIFFCAKEECTQIFKNIYKLVLYWTDVDQNICLRLVNGFTFNTAIHSCGSFLALVYIIYQITSVLRLTPNHLNQRHKSVRKCMCGAACCLVTFTNKTRVLFNSNGL
jgi:hypothetical protein